MGVDIKELIHTEDQQYGVPDWISFPLISAESSFNPQASNPPFTGLLQIGPTYPGASGHVLTDPQQNLQVGLPPLATALHQAQAAGLDFATPNRAAYDFVLTHSGHPTFTGDWAGQQAAFEAGYDHEVQASSGEVHNGTYGGGGGGDNPLLNAANSAISFGPLNPLGGISNPIGGVSDLASAVGGFFGQIGQHKGEAIVVILALLVFLGTAFKLIGGSGAGKAAAKAALL